jgi:hypothetical protein
MRIKSLLIDNVDFLVSDICIMFSWKCCPAWLSRRTPKSRNISLKKRFQQIQSIDLRLCLKRKKMSPIQGKINVQCLATRKLSDRHIHLVAKEVNNVDTKFMVKHLKGTGFYHFSYSCFLLLYICVTWCTQSLTASLMASLYTPIEKCAETETMTKMTMGDSWHICCHLD